MSLTDPVVWVTVAVWLIFFGAAAFYIRYATGLSELVNNRYPELWGNIFPRSWMSRSRIRPGAPRLERLIFFNAAADDHPDDPEFRWLLEQARWTAAISLLAFVAAAALTGLADINAHQAMHGYSN